jgi:biopolymer transport protein ExbB/TolQ
MEGLASNVNFISWFIEFMLKGGYFMWIILTIWMVGVAIAMERYLKLSKTFDVDGPSFMNELQRYVLANDIQGAIRVCSGSKAALARVLKSGLKRANHVTEQVQNAIDATALEVNPKIEMRLAYLPMIANIATLFGLLGTIQGLIQSFSAIAAADPSKKAEVLSQGISVAMYTTAFGIFAAITLIIIHSILQSKSEKIVSEIDEFSVKLIDMLGTKGSKTQESED